MSRRETAIAGLLTTLFFVGALVDDFFGSVPGDDAPGPELSASIANPDWATLASVFFWGLGCIAMTWFFVGLRGYVACASEALANVAFGPASQPSHCSRSHPRLTWAVGSGAIRRTAISSRAQPRR